MERVAASEQRRKSLNGLKTFTCKQRPASGLDCLIRAPFARQRTVLHVTVPTVLHVHHSPYSRTTCCSCSLQRLLPESKGQNLALTVLYV